MNFAEIKAELDKNNVIYDISASEEELLDKFYALPLTEAQKATLLSFGIVYKDSWNWSRKTAVSFIDEAVEYSKLLKKLPVSPRQKAVLIEHGVFDFDGMDSGRAAEVIYNLPADREQIDYLMRFKLIPEETEGLLYGYALRLIRSHKNKIMGTDGISAGLD